MVVWGTPTGWGGDQAQDRLARGQRLDVPGGGAGYPYHAGTRGGLVLARVYLYGRLVTGDFDRPRVASGLIGVLRQHDGNAIFDLDLGWYPKYHQGGVWVLGQGRRTASGGDT